MATDILIKRSTTTGAVPTTGDLSTGELAINTVDKRLFTNNSGTIVEIGTAPTSLAVTNNATVGGTLGVTGNTTVATLSTSGAATLASGSVTGNFSVAGTLTVATPSNSTDAASKGYVDTAVANVIDSAPAALDTLNELAAALNDDASFATTVTTALAGKLALAGGTMTGDITLGANKITSTATPATDDTLTRKGYVDSILGSATSAATSAAAAATSETNAANSASAASTSASNASTSATNAATSETNASTSATNASTSATAAASSATSASNSATASANSATAAATSATNAENAYDSFDDRYLGAKSSAPSVDNDGDALITGALYFDTTANAMRVYTGSAWADLATDTTKLAIANNLSDLNSAATALTNLGLTATAAELNALDGITATVTELNYTDGVTSAIQTQLDAKIDETSATGSAALPAGTTAQRDGSPAAGYLRFNTTDGGFEGYDGSAWGAVGGSGGGYFLGENGQTGDTSTGLGDIFRVHEDALDTAVTIAANTNASCTGPITFNATVTVNGTLTVV